jgi:hypothetical protein
MSESDVLAYLAVDKRKLTRLMVERGLRRHEMTRCFARCQVEALAKTIEQEIINGYASTVERAGSEVGGHDRFRQKAKVVP